MIVLADGIFKSHVFEAEAGIAKTEINGSLTVFKSGGGQSEGGVVLRRYYRQIGKARCGIHFEIGLKGEFLADEVGIWSVGTHFYRAARRSVNGDDVFADALVIADDGSVGRSDGQGKGSFVRDAVFGYLDVRLDG